MRQTLCFLYSPIRLTIILVLSPLLTAFYWLISTVAIPSYLLRNLVSLVAHLFDRDLCKIVNSMGHLISRDYQDWHRSPSHMVTTVFKLTGSPTIHQVRELFLKKWVHKTNLNHNKLEYPELQQYLTKRFGFLFFKWDRTFDIANHVNVYQSKELLPNPETNVVTESTLIKIWETVMIRPLLKKRSPWNIHLIPNYVPPKSGKDLNNPEEKQFVLILQTHHALCDGASTYKLLLTLTDNGLENLEKDVAAFRQAPPCMDLLIHLKAYFLGPTSMTRKLSYGFDIYNPLHRPLWKKAGKGHIVMSSIDLEVVKKICRVHLDVSFHSVLMAALAGAIRNYLLGNGHSIPLSPIKLGLPILKPGHSHKLRNEYLISVIDLPVDKSTPKKRLFATEKRVKELASESFMPFMAQTWQIIGLFPAQLSRFLTLKSAVTLGYSEIKGPSKLLTVSDGKYKLLDLVFSFGLGPDDLGVGFSSISYNGRLNLVLTLDHGVSKSRDKAQQLFNLIEKELEELQYGDSTNL